MKVKAVLNGNTALLKIFIDIIYFIEYLVSYTVTILNNLTG